MPTALDIYTRDETDLTVDDVIGYGDRRTLNIDMLDIT